MSDLRSIARNTSVLFATDMLNKVLGFLYVAYATRALGSAGFGIINGAIALVSLLSFFSDVGLSTLVVREVARDKSSLSKYMDNVIGAKIPLNILTFLLIVITANLLGYPQETAYAIYLIGLSTIVSSFYGVFNAVFQAHERSGVPVHRPGDELGPYCSAAPPWRPTITRASSSGRRYTC